MFEMVATSLAVRAIGSALLQSIWQGAVVCGITAIVLLALRRQSAKARYAAACAGLVVMVAIPVFTAAGSLRELDTSRDEWRQPAANTRAIATNIASPRLPNAAPRSFSKALPDAWEGGSANTSDVSAWRAAAVLFWAAGVLLLSLRLFRSWLIVERVRRTAVQPVPETWQARGTAMAHRLRLMRPVRILESHLVETPIVIGWLRPVILVPASVLTGLPTVQLEAIIAHELAHVQRHDYLVNVLQTIAETGLFYHPGTWWLSRQIRLERELCCDDVAVALCDDRREYARALANLEELRQAGPNLGLGAAAGPLERRVRRILGAPTSDQHRSALWAGVWLLAAALAFGLQEPRLRGAAAQSTPASGGVRGQVLDARSGKPLEGASISVSQVGAGRSAVTASDGRYEIRGLEPGEYRLSVRAPGFVEAQYGQRQVGEDGTSIEILNGQITSGIDVRLQSSGIVSGQILGDTGKGLPHVEVELMTERYLPGGPELVPAGFAQTDGSGEFRVGGLTPGEYDVRAYAQSNVRPSRGGDTSQVYAPTYFPGVTRIDAAQPILVSAGQEVFNLHFVLATVKTRVVTGTLVGPAAGAFDPMKVVMVRRGGNSALNQTVSVSSDGSFQFRNVVPDDYLLTVLGSSQDSHWHWAMRTVTVDDDVSGLELVGRRDIPVVGRLVRDGGGPLPFDPHRVEVGFEQRTDRRPGIADLVQLFGSHAVQADGTFSIESPGGPSFMRISHLPAGWTVKAIRMDGVDVTDQASELGDGITRQAEIVLTDRIADVVGVVTDRNGRAISNYTVVVFPEDRNRWMPPSRLVRGVRPSSDGSYRIEDLPPASYRAVAVDSLPRNAWVDPNVLERLWSSSTPFRLNEGEQRAVNLRLSQRPDGLLAGY